jgi:glycosyltransferase involved in cell wall biosynthesis
MELSVIIPVYNEEKNIAVLHQRLSEVIHKITGEYELIFVNDGSRDNTLALVKDISKQDTHVRYINFSRNFGHQVAVTAGLDHSSGNTVVIIDADLQDPPELISEMYSKMKEGYDVVYAKRKSRKGETFMKKFTAKVFYRLLQRITSVSIPVDTGDFRIISRKIVEVLKQMPEQQKYLRGQIAWAGYRQTFIEYERQQRHAGETGWPYRKMIRFALDGITSFSNFPLKFATVSGIIVFFISFILILYALYSRFITKEYVAGWTSLMLVVLFIGGIQLLSIGIIGEYISRISANVRNRPLYIIEETNIAKAE